ncbi:SWIM zinc finger family protein [Catellatospora sp. KI3]|uniref:SWIM zinc finger family protein n=1 Tax=Catellatospora sp. KI3 TaxID=3041620 RepID=UPI00248237B4|nr:SWIM zinc finger family protein [Catellatospora sp. KI3]MDI1462871.1 SWIM zinc finger family protein [Catellatospora sp. KI3]
MPRRPTTAADIWENFPAAKPRLPADGIRAVSRRGAIATTWWSRRFLAAIESPQTSGRLTRGRSYARTGQVLSLAITAGKVTAPVQGSRQQPYDVVLSVPVFRPADWKRIVAALAGQAAFSAALLAGQMPQDIEEVLDDLGISLFPTPRQLKNECSCPDWGNPCKHAAAVCYLLAERFDADPFAILALRGMAREPLLAAIRAHRERSTGGGTAAAPAADELSGFWDAGPLPPLPPPGEGAAVGVLDRLGPTGVTVRGRDLAELLAPAYEAMTLRPGR